MTTKRAHWEDVYARKATAELSWSRPHLDHSLLCIESLNVATTANIVDIGGGTATLAGDQVLMEKWVAVTRSGWSLAKSDDRRLRLVLGNGAGVESLVETEVTCVQIQRSEGQTDLV